MYDGTCGSGNVRVSLAKKTGDGNFGNGAGHIGNFDDKVSSGAFASYVTTLENC